MAKPELLSNSQGGDEWEILSEMADKMGVPNTEAEALGSDVVESTTERIDDQDSIDKIAEMNRYNPALTERCLALGEEHKVDFGPLLGNLAMRCESAADEDERGAWRRSDSWVGQRAEMIEDFSDGVLLNLGKLYRDMPQMASETDFRLDRDNETMETVLDNYNRMRDILLPGQESEKPVKEKGGFFERIRKKFQRRSERAEAAPNLPEQQVNSEDYRQKADTWCENLLRTELETVDAESLAAITKRAKTIMTSECRVGEKPSRISSTELMRDTKDTIKAEMSLGGVIEQYDRLLKLDEKEIDDVTFRNERRLLQRIGSSYRSKTEDYDYVEENIFPILENCDAAGSARATGLIEFGLSRDARVLSKERNGHEYTDFVVAEILPALDDEGILNGESKNGGQKTKLVESLIRSSDGTIGSTPQSLETRFKIAQQDCFPLLDQCDSAMAADEVRQIVEKKFFGPETVSLSPEERQQFVETQSDLIKKYTIDLLDGPKETELMRKRLYDYAGGDRTLLNHYRESLFDDMNNNPEKYQELLSDNNTEVRGRGGVMLRNYELGCLTGRNTPRDINRLMHERRELPTSSMEKLSQNRVDALAIEGTVIDDHGFIHDEVPMTHNVLESMVKFYDAQGTPEAETAEADLNKAIAECMNLSHGRYGDLAEKALDLKNYDRLIQGEVRDDRRIEYYNERAIDIVRRLAENTDSSKIELPETDDAELKGLIEAAGYRYDSEHDTIKVDWQGAGKLINYLNVQMISRKGEFGLDAGTIELLSFGESVATYAMRGVTESERRELPYDPVFKELVRFQALTASFDDYDHEKFENFYDRFSSMKMDDEFDLSEKYELLQRHILEQSNKLAKYYNKTPRYSMFGDRNMNDTYSSFVPELLSGNLTHELIGLIDSRKGGTIRDRTDAELQAMGAH